MGAIHIKKILIGLKVCGTCKHRLAPARLAN